MKRPDLTAAAAPNAPEQHRITPTSIASSRGVHIPLQPALHHLNRHQKKRMGIGNHSLSSPSRLHRPDWHRLLLLRLLLLRLQLIASRMLVFHLNDASKAGTKKLSDNNISLKLGITKNDSGNELPAFMLDSSWNGFTLSD